VIVVMHDWTVVVRLRSGDSVSEQAVRRVVERRGAVSRSEADLLIAVPDRESAYALARDVSGIEGVVHAYPKPPVGLP
jgi:hypothetical protein